MNATKQQQQHADGGQPVGVIAKLLLLSERRVQQLANEGVIPKAEGRRYSLVGAVQGYIRYLQARAASVPEGIGSNYQDERTKLIRVQREMAELDLARTRREVVWKADVLRIFREAMTIYSGETDSMAARCAAEFAGTSDAVMIKERMLAEERVARESASRRVMAFFSAEPDGVE